MVRFLAESVSDTVINNEGVGSPEQKDYLSCESKGLSIVNETTFNK